MKTFTTRLLLILAISSLTLSTFGQTTYYVATDGDNSNSGTESEPFKTIQKGYSVLSPGDTAIVMPGTYADKVSLTNNSGTEGNLITIIASDNSNKPIITGGVYMENCSYMRFKGFEVTVTMMKGKNAGFNNNILENLDVHHITKFPWGDLQGFSVYGGSHHNLLLNCDFHHNVKFSGSNCDGMGFSMVEGDNSNGGPHDNTIKFCRSYFNNDDGFDTWWSGANNRYEGCWSFGNGKDSDFNPIEGDGNGFKLGQGEYNKPIVVNCIAFENNNKGFDENANQAGGIELYNCTSYANNQDYAFWSAPQDIIVNCVTVSGDVSELEGANDYNNNWNLEITADASDFITLDYSDNMNPRKPDGSLPDSDFLKLKSTSDLINRGIEVELPYIGVAPDLGAYEYDGVVVSPPTANFSANSRNIYEADSIKFKDKSTYNPKSWTWTFEGGTPATSIEQHPTVAYNVAGEYDVTLVVTNADGTDTKTVADMITVKVLPPAPIAIFFASDTLILENSYVTFTDSSLNDPTKRRWTFEGGAPESSMAKNPSIKYSKAGSYNVTLTVTNDGGSSTETKIDMIVVDSAGTSINTIKNSNLNLSNYPNPFSKKTVITYTLNKKCTVKLVIYNAFGKEIEVLVNKIQQAGNYETIWTASDLASGIYLIDLKSGSEQSVQKAIIK